MGGSFNVAAHLPRQAGSQPDRPGVIAPAGRDRQDRPRYHQLSYRQLEEDSSLVAQALSGLGIGRGTRTVLMVKPGLDFFSLTFALFKIGAVPVFVDPGMGIRNLGQCLAEAEPTAFIGIPKAHVARWLFGWARLSLRVLVTVGRRWGWGGHSLASLRAKTTRKQEFPPAETAAAELAGILFTSGSTGVPKGAVYTHGMFAAQVEMLRRTYAIEPGEVDLTTFPLFALFAPALGMSAVVPDMDPTRPAHVNPRRILEAIEEFQCTNLFGSPALLRRVGRFAAEQGVRLPSLRRVISAGAPVPVSVLETFSKLLAPGVEVFTPYGATEALPMCSIGSAAILQETRALSAQGAGTCVGRPVEPIGLHIIRISDEPIPAWSDELLVPQGEIGEIVVRGPVVSPEYYRRPEMTALHKIAADDGVIYHRTGDAGYFDEAGRVWFCGRKSERVITSSGTLFTTPCEGIFDVHPQVHRSALVGLGPRGQQQPVLCVEAEPGLTPAAGKKLAEELLSLARSNPQTARITAVLFHPGFPVDIRHNSKINRGELARWAAGKV
ncbi:MAG: fatty acid CoA ligase family protein [Gemmataceae bacterium]